MGEFVTVYHGTCRDNLRKIQATEGDVFGMAYQNGADSFSGNLTDDKWVATQFAICNTRIGMIEQGQRVVITFQIPREMIINIGKIPGYNADGYVTNDIVPSEQVPDSYLEQSQMERSIAVEGASQGIIYFYRISSQLQIGIEEF